MGKIMNTHGIPATSWQLEAASAGRLKAIVLPLLPEPEFDAGLWRWHPTHLEVLSVWSDGMPFESHRLLDYQVGDRIYLQEEWAKEDGLFVSRSEDQNDDYQWFGDAEDMPPEAAQYWFSIKNVKVCQFRHLNSLETAQSNLMMLKLVDEFKILSSEEEDQKLQEHVDDLIQKWNTEYPDYPFDRDRWVVLLTIEQEPSR
jgi:hypothetical protein